MKWLFPLAWLFQLFVAIRNFLYDWRILPVRALPGVVISIGNISIGGTGKSPLVQYVIAQLVAHGKTPVILTRGYKSGLHRGEWQVLLDGHVVAGVKRDDVRADEAIMQSVAQPNVYVVVGAKRYEAALSFLAHVKQIKPTHWVLDDGFQHRKIRRDVDVVAIDVRAPWGLCFPAGLFRERKFALRRAGIVVMTKSQDPATSGAVKEKVHSINPRCQIYEARIQQEPLKLVCGTACRHGAEYAVVCGIARPDDFLNALQSMGVNIVRVFQYPDHSSFDPSAVGEQRAAFQGIVTTEKDWARDSEQFKRLDLPVYVAPLRVTWVGRQLDF